MYDRGSIHRKVAVLAGLMVWMVLGAVISSHCHAQSGGDRNVFDERRMNPAYFEEYERQLNAILKTRRDQEKEFVSLLVGQIKEDKIPVRLIDTSFEWVRNKRPDTEYPFLLFEKVLRLQAKKLGIEDEIPPFDYSIYKSGGQQAEGQQLNAGRPTEKQKENLFNRFFRRKFLLE